MSNILELRLTKTEFEKILTGIALSDFMKNFNLQAGERDLQFMKMLLLFAEMNGLKDYVTRIDGEIVVSEKIIKKMVKILDNYNSESFQQRIDDLFNEEEIEKERKAMKKVVYQLSPGRAKTKQLIGFQR